MAGIGGKTAAKLINEYGTVENLLAQLPAVQPEASGQDRSRPGTNPGQPPDGRPRHHLPLLQPIPELTIAPQFPALIEALRDCEFKGLLKEVEAEAGSKELKQGDLL